MTGSVGMTHQEHPNGPNFSSSELWSGRGSPSPQGMLGHRTSSPALAQQRFLRDPKVTAWAWPQSRELLAKGGEDHPNGRDFTSSLLAVEARNDAVCLAR